MHQAQPSIFSLPEMPAFNALPMAVYTCDADGVINFFNEAAADLWGRRPEPEKDRWTGAFKTYDTNGLPIAPGKCPMAITIKQSKQQPAVEIIIERPDGSRLNVIPHISPLFDATGKLTGGINTLVDVSAGKYMQLRMQEIEDRFSEMSTENRGNTERTGVLEKNERWYHKMIEEVQDYAIILLDLNGNILNWNKGAQKIKGYTEDEIIGKNFRLFYRRSDQLEMLPEKLITEAVEKGRAAHEGWRVRKDGSHFWGSVVITALHDEQNNIIGFSKVTRDLTEKKLADDRLQEYMTNISYQNSQLERYAYIASHDLQEPLRKIRVFADMLDQKYDDPEALIKYTGKIKNAAARMSDLVKDILAYSKISSPEQEFEDIDLNKIITDIKHDFELLLEEKKVKLVSSPLPSIKGVGVQIRQLFANLISNAIKFSDSNPVINISSAFLPKDEVKKNNDLNSSYDYLHLSVKDNGIGFEQKYAPEVFDLFKRLNAEKAGTGIGLALCKKVVEKHGGVITVNSAIGKGSCFNIFLPVK